MRPLTRQSCHPVMLGQMVMLALVSAWQLLGHAEHPSTFWHVPSGSYLPLALVVLLGCISCIVATIQSDSWTAASFELFGAVLLVVALGVDLAAVIDTGTPKNDIVTGLLAGAVVGLAIRIVQVCQDVSLIVKARGAPPVGDLDLMAAGKVDSVTALVVGSHGAEIAVEEAEAAMVKKSGKNEEAS